MKYAGNKLYLVPVINKLIEKNDKVDRRYKDDSKTKELDFKDIKYIKREKNNKQT